MTTTTANTIPWVNLTNTGGYTYTTSGTSGTSPTITISNSPYTISNPNTYNIQNQLQVHGDSEFFGDIKMKGKSLKESLEKIEERLAILHPNEELEEKWEKLRELRKEYIALEQDIIEKEKIWKILKK